MPDNAVFYHAAYAAAVVIYGGYVISLVVRSRRTRARERRQMQRGLAREVNSEL
ncbi:MAG TPA: hypothetical protein VL308_01115 [Gemmatimonadaceae bacterium]|jgi:hypothetical protein|nr:hypothetical protein [Gemmatimonadaceae bacterium]